MNSTMEKINMQTIDKAMVNRIRINELYHYRMINDVNNKEDYPVGIVQFDDNNMELAAIYEAQRQCLYRIYFSDTDSKMHVSNKGVGGILERGYLGYNIDKYNADTTYRPTNKIKKIYWADGSIFEYHSVAQYGE